MHSEHRDSKLEHLTRLVASQLLIFRKAIKERLARGLGRKEVQLVLAEAAGQPNSSQ